MATNKVRLVLGIVLLAGIFYTAITDASKHSKRKKLKGGGFVPATPSATQAKWLDYEVGASIHFNMQTFTRNMSRGNVAPANTFNPRNLSTDQWADVAASFGSRFVVLTLDHFSGFLLWPSQHSNYSVRNTTWRNGTGNIAFDFINSCKNRSMDYGYFYSVNKNWNLNVENYSTLNPLDQKTYNDIALAQMTELLGNGSVYSNPFYWWFDAGTDPKTNPDIGPLMRSLAKHTICDECLTFAGNQGAKWIGNENAVAPLPNWYAVPKGKCYLNLEDPRGDQFCPSSCDTVVREHYWFWKPGTEHTIKTPQRLLQEYLTSVGRGCNLILNLSPDDTGLVPELDVKAYRALGEGIKLLYKHPVLILKSPTVTVEETYTVQLPSDFEAINGSFIIMEDVLNLGQRVDQYTIQYITDTIVETEEGTSIGHKRIHAFPLSLRWLTLTKIELTIKSVLTDDKEIRLRELSVYDWSEAEKKGFLDQSKIFRLGERKDEDDGKKQSIAHDKKKKKTQ